MATKETIEAYVAAWNEPDEAKRHSILEKAWTRDATYTDPMSHADGLDELVALVSQFHKQMPGAQIARASGIDEQHGRLRFAWKLQMGDGSTRMEGIYISHLAEDGRLQSIVGFFGPPLAA